MKIISEANETVLTILKKFVSSNRCERWSQYCLQLKIEDGVLVFNLLTRELILLSQEEYSNFTDIDYLRERFFAVSAQTKEKEYADLVKWVITARRPNLKEITNYVIFPTTDCNARCFYCFELGRSRIPMSNETAESVVQYIKEHCGGKEVRISWFGGEPLLNQDAIETICDGLSREDIAFKSDMVSNGYLFDDATVQKAVEKWNLKKVQITLDGTETVYNKTKAYIYRNGSPYTRVMENIACLLDASVRVAIRLNMDLYNAEDLLALTKELAQRFSGKKGLSVYAHHLFKGDIQDAELHTDEEWEKRDVAMQRLTDCLFENGLARKAGISKKIKQNFCIADNGNTVTILPDGKIGLCEHYSETEFIGQIDGQGFDASVVRSWQERMPEIPECAECFYFLDCVKLRKCPNDGSCYRQFRQEKLRETQSQMRNQYQKWLTKIVEEDEDNNDC